MIVFAILVASAIFLDNVSGNGILYDGRSTFSKVELSQHIEFKDFTISVWFNMKRKVSHRHLPQCIFAKGNWISSKPRSDLYLEIYLIALWFIITICFCFICLERQQ